MNLYTFILGRKNLLSTAEIVNSLQNEHQIIDIQRESLIANLNSKLLRPQASLNKLGGTIKIAEVFAQFPLTLEDISSPISEHLIKTFKDQDTKLTYGLSIYNFAQKNEEIIKNTLNLVKKRLKEEGIRSRFINKNFQNLKNAAIKGEKLITKGAEIVIIQGKHKLFFAKTIALQEFENYSNRDYNRPARDAKLGMLPPKLAQIMINLGGFTNLESSENTNKTVYDPFTGMGTILTEGLLLKYDVVGSDINPEVLEGAKENIFWTYQNDRSIENTFKLFQKDATSLTKQDIPEQIDLVVTESYLGKKKKKVPDAKQMHKNFNHIEELLTRFFRQMHKIVPQNTPIIISFAVYKEKHHFHTLRTLPQKIEKIGYKISPLIPKKIAAKFNIRSENNLIYDRPNQTVGRQIWKFISR